MRSLIKRIARRILRQELFNQEQERLRLAKENVELLKDKRDCVSENSKLKLELQEITKIRYIIPDFIICGILSVLPKGTGYVTDLGMTGPRDSILGIRPDLSIAKFRGDLTERYRWADGPTKMEAALFTIDSATGLCRKAERVDEWD